MVLLSTVVFLLFASQIRFRFSLEPIFDSKAPDIFQPA